MAAFPAAKALEEFKVSASSVPQATFDYLASLEWIRARENVVFLGPPGTGKSHCETDHPVPSWAGSPDWSWQRRG